VVYLPRPTAVPVVPALSLAVILIGLLGEWYWLSAIGGVGMIGGLAAWVLRNEAERSIVDESPEIDGLPLDTTGPRAAGWWGYAAAIVIGAAGLATLAFSAVFLQVHTEAWPPDGRLEGWLLPALALVALVVAAGVTWRGGNVARDRADPSAGR